MGVNPRLDQARSPVSQVRLDPQHTYSASLRIAVAAQLQHNEKHGSGSLR